MFSNEGSWLLRMGSAWSRINYRKREDGWLSITKFATREMGDLKTVHTVARARASNIVAVAIPCFHVVRRIGELGGYRWGLDQLQQDHSFEILSVRWMQ